jgi:hypothetical protein
MPHKAPGQSSEILVRAYQRIRTSCPSIADRWIVDADIVDVMVAAYPSLDDPDTPLLNSAKFNKAVTTYGNTTLGPNFPMPNNPTGHYRVVHSLTPTTNGKRVTQRKTFYYYESSPRVNGFPEIPKNTNQAAWQELVDQSAATTRAFLADPSNVAAFHKDDEIVEALKILSKGEVVVVATTSPVHNLVDNNISAVVATTSPRNNLDGNIPSRFCCTCCGIAPRTDFDEIVRRSLLEHLNKLPTDNLLATKMPSEFDLVGAQNLRVIVDPPKIAQRSEDSVPINDDDRNKENSETMNYRIYSSGSQPCLQKLGTETSLRCSACKKAADRLRKLSCRLDASLSSQNPYQHLTASKLAIRTNATGIHAASGDTIDSSNETSWRGGATFTTSISSLFDVAFIHLVFFYSG